MTLYNHKGKPVNLTFTDLLFTSFNASTRRGAKSLPVSLHPHPIAQCVPSGHLPLDFSACSRPIIQFQKKAPDPPPPAEEAPPHPPSPPPPPALKKPAAPEAPAAPPLPPWTATEDFVLRTLKAQDRTWKEIEEFLPGREKAILIARYKVLMKDDGVSDKSDGSAQGNGKGKKGNQGNKPKGILKEGKSPKSGEAAAAGKSKSPSIIDVGEGEVLSGAEVHCFTVLNRVWKNANQV